MPPTATTPGASGSRRALLVSFALALLAVVAMTVGRVRTTLADPNFDAHDARGLLKSDPALLVYLAERVVESDGRMPDDFHADPRIEHPDGQDVVRTLPVTQEFVVAWLRLALGDALPFHVFCLWVAGAFASLTLLGTWILARELSGDAWLALLATLLAAALPASWRTTGFVLMDEDFSLPFLALHLGLLARAARRPTVGAALVSALALAAAVATWHATQFLVLLEVAAITVVAVVRGPTAADARAAFARVAWIHVAALVAVGFAVPFLRASGFALATPVTALAGLALAHAAPPRASASARGAVTIACVAACVAAGAVVRGDGATYEHVSGLLAAKLVHLGALPSDPSALTPDVRLMWQGPFATLEPSTAWTQLGLALVAVVAALVSATTMLRATARGGETTILALALLVVLAAAGAWAVQRVVVLPAIVAPAFLAAWIARRASPGRARAALGALAAVQVALGASWLASYVNPWYASPRQRQAEIRAMVEALPRFVPPGEAVAADAMNASAILVHARRGGILSPKWESAESRARVVEFLHAFAHESPAAFRERLRKRWRCRFLLVDRFTLGYLSAYAAGFPPGDPPPGTAAAAFLATDAATLESVPGFRLLWRSPESIRQSNGTPTDFYRLYELAP